MGRAGSVIASELGHPNPCGTVDPPIPTSSSDLKQARLRPHMQTARGERSGGVCRDRDIRLRDRLRRRRR